MDAIKLLVVDHKMVEELFLQFEAVGDEEPNKKAELAAMICKELTVRMMIKEELFYPAARAVKGMEDMIDAALQEHAETKEMIAKIKTLSTGYELEEEMSKLKKAIKHHVEEEETEMFPKLQKQGMETTNLGAQMMERKLQLKATL